jgi:hypothetical protein
MTNFDDLETQVPVFNVIDADGNVVEQKVPADYPIADGQSLEPAGTIPTYELIGYLKTFQAIIDKIKSL